MNTLGFIFTLAAAVTWGLAYTLDQKILTNLSPLALLFAHGLATVLIILPILLWKHETLNFSSVLNKNSIILILVTVILATTANFFIFSGIKILGASTASIFEIMYPFFVVLFSYIILDAKPNLHFLFGAILIFSGSAIIIANSK